MIDREPQQIESREVELVETLASALATAAELSIEIEQRNRAEQDLALTLDELRSALSYLEASTESQHRLVTIARHELTNVLNGISGFSEIIRDYDLSPEEVREFATDINNDTQRLSRMIRELLDVERMHEQHMILQSVTTVDVSELIEDVTAYARVRYTRHPFNLNLQPHLFIDADGDKITQALRNLVSNAVKYSPEGGEISITARADQDMVSIAITDNGIGIPIDQQDLIFEPNIRINSDETAGISGSGLGLSVVRSVIELHGGEISVRSTHGVGSTFTIRLPLSDRS
jgi:signal transduction histidine kinase